MKEKIHRGTSCFVINFENVEQAKNKLKKNGKLFGAIDFKIERL